LSFTRVEVLSPSAGWITIQGDPKATRTVEIPFQTSIETEIAQTLVKDGEYTHIKLYLADENYIVLSTNPKNLQPLYFKRDHDDSADKGDKGHDGNHDRNHDGDHEDDDAGEHDDLVKKGHRFKIKHFKPVFVKKGNLTTVYLEMEIDELVEYKDHSNQFVLDHAKADFIESVLTPIILPKDVKTPGSMPKEDKKLILNTL